jgi:two-component system sensor histidine kinase DctS
MLNFEPHEIAKLLSENQMVIESVKDAIIAVDMHGRITVINRAAKKILKLKQNAAGQHISTVLPNSYLEEVLSSGKEIFDTYRKLGGIPCLVTVQPIIIQRRQVGALACFRDRSEAHRLAEELTGVRKFTDELRAQAHEFSNKLHTLLGLLHFKEYEKAEALILQGAELRTQLISQLENSIESPVVRGLLYGKLATCEEKNIHIELSLPSFITNDIGVPSQDITLVLGNFIENAIESVEHSRVQSPEIHISMLLGNSDLCLQVHDNGGGIPRHIASTLFSQHPQSSKEGHRGLGLRFVKKIADFYGGKVSFSSDPEQGTVFTITLPIVSACAISTAY